MLVGTVMRDPERRGQRGDLATFTVATSESFKKKDGTTGYTSEYHNCSVWGKMADDAMEQIYDKARIAVEGKITQNKKEKEDGSKVVYNGINVHKFYVLRATLKEEPQAPGEEPQEDFSSSFVDPGDTAERRKERQNAAMERQNKRAQGDDIDISEVPF